MYGDVCKVPHQWRWVSIHRQEVFKDTVFHQLAEVKAFCQYILFQMILAGVLVVVMLSGVRV